MDTIAQAILEVAESDAGQGDPGLITLSNGVILRIRSISKDVYINALGKFPPPEIPRVKTPKGRIEENPNDPDYIEKLKQYRLNIARAVTLAVYAMGVELVSVPPTVKGPHDDDWLEELRLSGLSSGDSERARVMDWLQYYAAKSTVDNQRIMSAAGRMVGVPETDVQEATKSL